MKRAITTGIFLAFSLWALGQNAVDLGLSVKWASCNVGATAPEQYGEYYAWGETSAKDIYSWNNHKWFDPNSKAKMDYKLSKYCSVKDYGTVDKKKELDLEDDVARAKLKGNWRMPTADEWEELLKKCSWQWTTQKGVKGYLVKSLKNGNSIFLPAAGHKIKDEISGEGNLGFYWSNNTGFGPNAYSVSFGSANRLKGSTLRSEGQSVRAVCE